MEKKQKKWKKKLVGKIKAKFPTSSILKKIHKDNFEKKHVGKHCSKTKTMWGNIVTIHNILKKKTTKQNSQPAQYEKKNRQRLFLKKKFIKKKPCREILY